MPKNEDQPITKLEPKRMRWVAALVGLDGKEYNNAPKGYVVDARRENIDVLLELARDVVPLRPADGPLGDEIRQHLKNIHRGPLDIIPLLVPNADGTEEKTLYKIPRLFLTGVSVNYLATLCGRPVDESKVFTGAYIARTGHAPPPQASAPLAQE